MDSHIGQHEEYLQLQGHHLSEFGKPTGVRRIQAAGGFSMLGQSGLAFEVPGRAAVVRPGGSAASVVFGVPQTDCYAITGKMRFQYIGMYPGTQTAELGAAGPTLGYGSIGRKPIPRVRTGNLRICKAILFPVRPPLTGHAVARIVRPQLPDGFQCSPISGLRPLHLYRLQPAIASLLSGSGLPDSLQPTRVIPLNPLLQGHPLLASRSLRRPCRRQRSQLPNTWDSSMSHPLLRIRPIPQLPLLRLLSLSARLPLRARR